MKASVLAAVCGLAAMSLLLEGCSVGATRPDNSGGAPVTTASVNISNLPQMMLSGGTPAEVKSLAMGAARSKGWTMLSATADQLVVQRPFEASSQSTLPSGRPLPSGTLLEVTSFFISQAGGVNVATQAELVAPNPGKAAPTRIDYTDAFREPLTQSLVSLRTGWSQHRDRLARATPPEGGWKDAWADFTPNPPPTAAASVAAASPPPVAAAPVAVKPSSPATTPAVAAVPAAKPPAPARPAPEPRRVADKANMMALPAAKPPLVKTSTTAAAKPAPAKAATPAAAKPAPAAAKPAATSTPAAKKANWSTAAEKYASQKGCKVTSKGTQLIESRKDGEVHKISCTGTDSVLVKCQNGTCKGLL